MRMRKSKQLVGLDIGSRAIKAAELEETKKGYSLKNFAAVDIAQGLIEDGVIREPEQVAETIRALFDQNRIKNRNVAFSIGGYSVIIKKISVDAVAGDQLNTLVAMEAEQYIPFDIQEVSLDYHVVGKNETNPNQLNVLLVAAKNDVVDAYAQLVELAGLTPCILDIDAFALQNAYEANYPAVEENLALIDIGASKASLNIVRNTASLFMRDVTQGCDQIDRAIVRQLGCSPAEAEEMKLAGGGSGRLSPDAYNGLVGSVVSQWSLEIRRALDFFYSSFPNDPVKKIILSGGGAHIAPFRDLLAMETNTEVVTFQPFQRIALNHHPIEPAYMEMIAPQAGICVGLAMRRLDDK